MNASLSSVLIYALGFIGIIAVGVIPVRSWFVLRRFFKGGNVAYKFGKILGALLVLIVAATLWADLQITFRIFRCLTQTYCGPGIASGWIYLAMLGFWYLFFETVIFVIQKFISGAGKQQVSVNNF